MPLTGKGALITGGTGALGRAVIAALAEAGATLAVSYTSDAGVVEIRGFLGPRADAVSFVKADVTREADVQHLVQAVASRLGRIDILLNLVGGYVGDIPVTHLPEATRPPTARPCRTPTPPRG